MPATDKYAAEDVSLESPATGGEAVTPHDTNELSYATRALWIGGAGNVRVEMLDGQTLTLSGVQAGTLLPIRVKKVLSTSTTATLIVALW